MARLWSQLPIILIIAVAAAMRLVSLDLVSITADEGIHGMFSMNVAVFQNWPIVGLPSVGIRNSAFFIYLLATAYFVNGHPLSGVVFVVLLNLAALYVMYRLADRYWGRLPAVVAAIFVTFAPWQVMYARNMWPPSCVPLFSLSLISTSFNWLATGSRKSLLALVLLTFLLPQLHFSGFCAVVWSAVVVWIGRKHLDRRAIGSALFACVIGFLTLVPWLHYQHSINQWADLTQALNAAKGKHGLLETIRDIAVYYQALLGSGQFTYWFTTHSSQLPEYFPAWLEPVRLAVQVATVSLFLASLGWSLWQPRTDIRLLAFWALLPFPLLLLIRPDIHPHYVGVAFPIPFLIIALFVQKLIDDRPKVQKATGLACFSAILIVTAICHTAFLYGWYQFVDAGRPDGSGHFQLSYRQRVAVADSIIRDNPHKLVHLAGAFSGMAPAYHFPYSYEQMRRKITEYPTDYHLRYWVDERRQQPTDANWVTERRWNVGPSEILRQRFDPQEYQRQLQSQEH